MEIKLIETANMKIAEVLSDGITIYDVQDALDIIGNADCQGARSIIIHQYLINPEFFNLRSGLAGEILQKFSTYGVKLAIIGDFDQFDSKALKAFIIECNRGRTVFFAADRDEAIKRISDNT